MQRSHLLPKSHRDQARGSALRPLSQQSWGCLSTQPPKCGSPSASLGQSYLLGGLIFNKSALCFSVLIKI